MPPAEGTFPIIAHAIQLAIAPVFLVTGIAAMLGVMANRLARVIDRARDLEQRWPNLDAAMRANVRIELQALEKPRHFASWSINFCTGAALLVCLVIVTLFVEEFFGANFRWLAGGLFVGAMISLICGLTSFLREVYIATRTIKFEVERLGI